MLKRKLWIIGMLVMALVITNLALVSPAYACSPMPEALNYTFQDRVENAPIILVGTVIDGDISWGNTLAQATVDVEAYLKGEGYEIVEIYGFGDGADCRSRVQLGEKYLFFAEGESGETLRAVYLGVHDAAYRARGDYISEAQLYTGQYDEPLPLPFVEKVNMWIEQYGRYGIGLLVTVLVLGIGMFAIRRVRTSARKTKAKRG